MKYVVDKPTSYYAMRGYLRLCTPVSIENEIQATVNGLKYSGTERGSVADSDPDLEFLRALPQ